MKIEEYLFKHGARETATKLVDMRLRNQLLNGLGIDDLPDSTQIFDIVDEVEEAISQEPINRPALVEALKQVNLELVEEILYS